MKQGREGWNLKMKSKLRLTDMLCIIRSLAQKLCYDLARAEKAKDGKKSKLRLKVCEARQRGVDG